MAATTITLSSVSCSSLINYRRDPATGADTYSATYVVCPTAINIPVGVTSYEYNLSLLCVDSADSSVTYDFTGTSAASTIGFTTYNPSSGDKWVDNPPINAKPGTYYVAVEDLTSGDGYTFTLSGTITFYTDNYYFEEFELNFADYKFAQTQTSDEPITVLINNLKLGSTQIKDYRLGSSAVKKIYLGDTLVYGETTTTGEYGIMRIDPETVVYLDSNAYDISINGIPIPVDEEVVIERITEGDDDDDRAYYTGVTSGVTPIQEIDVCAYLHGQDNTLVIYVNEEWECDVNAYMYVVVRWLNKVRYKM